MIDITEFRHYLHANPELSGSEFNTSKSICHVLNELECDRIFSDFAGNAVIAVFNGNPAKKTIAFRADIDALPIDEKTRLPYSSATANVSHKCGHDGHTAILLDFASKIAKRKNDFGKIILIFQAAEETGMGASEILKSNVLQKLKPDAVFGLHNLPGFPSGSVVMRYNTFAAASCGLIIRLKGLEAHAAYPENGINPAPAVAEIIRSLNEINSSNQEIDNFRQATLIYTRIGKVAFGTSAGDAEIMLTLRSFNNKKMKELVDYVEETATLSASKFHLDIDFDYQDKFNALENRNDYVDIIKNAALLLHFQTIFTDEPRRWSEDFAEYLLQFNGAFFGIGSGENHLPLHHPDYDFPDEIISPASDLFLKIAEIACKQ